MLFLDFLGFFTIAVLSGCVANAQPEGILSFRNSTGPGLFPVIFNLATQATIEANATCGESEAEEYCKLVEHVKELHGPNQHCDICNAKEPLRAHPISYAIDGTNRRWQSPTLTNGKQYNYVTITLNLGQVFQIAYIVIKAANSPRPGNWILERSLDGETFTPWQYFTMEDSECWSRYGLRPSPLIPEFTHDDQVICSSQYSKLDPLEGGEIFISLINGRPGALQPSATLLEFTRAHYIRLRFQKIRTLNADLMTIRFSHSSQIDSSVTRRYFYSIKDISVGGQCICSGHARHCEVSNGKSFQCKCEHNTCGKSCEKCCPLFNQLKYQRGTNGEGFVCEECNCNGHANSCIFNSTVEALGLSVNKQGKREGGGQCLDCQDFTAGINCESCVDSYYRPSGKPPDSHYPCYPCQCSASHGNTGRCYPDDSRMDEGFEPGDCVCEPGYGGKQCDRCAVGYYDYPNCKPCTCNPAGTANPDLCGDTCICKKNVEGNDCSRCKSGYFNLDVNNPDGCTPCYCFGVSNVCESSTWGRTEIRKMAEWHVLALTDREWMIIPSQMDGWLAARTYRQQDFNILSDSSRTFDKRFLYYWKAPVEYTGNLLASYGGTLKYTIKYTLDHASVSGYHLFESDVIIESPFMAITTKRAYQREKLETVVRHTLHESEWYRVDLSTNRVDPNPIDRETLMNILRHVNNLFIRATYHSAQDITFLKDVVLEKLCEISSPKKLPSVEYCKCPEGFVGQSCEDCAAGWRRLNDTVYGGKCIKCECYRHADTCDPYTGKCVDCKHNTTGNRCEKCLDGFYGDPRYGREDDCKPCACPLPERNNFFASNCEHRPTVGNRDAYVCINCKEGYYGAHCERCAPGYFGNPLQIGGMCRKCECGGNVDLRDPNACDSRTGECLGCLNNTEGVHCEICKDGFYGDAFRGGCRACECDSYGSEGSICDKITGKCLCKPRYTGRSCNRCEPHYGNVAEGCTRCNCHRTGSLDSRCDSVTGQCTCRPGITGDRCDKCKDGFYGFSSSGCRDCGCSEYGTTEGNKCDSRTGQCHCRRNVVGRMCDQCLPNQWGLQLGEGCQDCLCNRTGSLRAACNDRTGQCPCKFGVGGQHCDQCLPGHYRFSRDGCRECETCDKIGHICDPLTGRCVCPPYTAGERCERCVAKTWDYNQNSGCRPCNCHPEGSVNLQCDLNNGACHCKLDYTGNHCDQCRFGFHQFPNCRQCMCSVEGTDPGSCHDDGSCSCDERGQCKCKKNVDGAKCTRCKQSSFSLDPRNPNGCTNCYCFGRSQTCSQAPFMWSKFSLPKRNIYFSDRSPNAPSRIGKYSYIPSNVSVVNVRNVPTNEIYWNLGDAINGDKTLSYNGNLKFSSHERHAGDRPSKTVENSLPVAVLIGNGFRLIHHSSHDRRHDSLGRLTLKLHESHWFPEEQPGIPASRELFMVTLQNLEAVLVRAAIWRGALTAEISDVELSIAVQQGTSNIKSALGLESCQCPPQYTGLSCQDPAPGYYRVKPPGPYNISNPTEAIGDVRPCNCHRHSDYCNPETGECIDCADKTTGVNCEKCLQGYYGDPTTGLPDACKICSCPLIDPRNNFSPTCMISEDSGYICTNCSTGHEGDHCEECAPGFYGRPLTPGQYCKPCDCDPEGSKSSVCDRQTGQCICVPGISGRACDECLPRHVVFKGDCVSCDRWSCTGPLLVDIDELLRNVSAVNTSITIIGPLPWDRLEKIQNETDALRIRLHSAKLHDLNHLKQEVQFIDDIASSRLPQTERIHRRGEKVRSDSVILRKNATDIERYINELAAQLREDIGKLHEVVERLYFNQSGANISAVFEKVKAILEEIEGRDFSNEAGIAYKEIALAEKLSEKINEMMQKNFNATEVAADLDEIFDRLRDLQKQAEYANRVASNSTEIYLDKAYKLGDIEDKLEEIENNEKETKNLLVDGEKLNNETRKLLDMARENQRLAERNADILSRVSEDLRAKSEHLADEIPESQYHVSRAWRHARRLQALAAQLENQFASAKASAKDPLKAAKVFEDIVKAIEDAEEAARKALDDAEKSNQLADIKKIQFEVESIVNRSLILLARANDTLRVGIPKLDAHLDDLNEDLRDVFDMQNEARDLLNRLRNDMRNIPKGVGDQARDISMNAMATSSNLNATNKRIDDIMENVKNKLEPALKGYEHATAEDLENEIRTSITSTRNNVDSWRNLTLSVDEQATKTQRLNYKIHQNLAVLKDNIRLAREQANSVKVSLATSGQCVRSYRSPSQAGVINTISFGFKTNSSNNNMLLVLVQKTPQEYMAVEIIQGKVKFSWNAGGGLGQVTYDLQIKPEGLSLNEASKWYEVHAQRNGRIGTLKVQNLGDITTMPEVVSGSSPPGFSLLNLDATSELFVAGAVAGYKLPVGVTSNNFTGCIGKLFVDGKNIGMFNFKKNSMHCSSCREVPSSAIGANVYQFDGTGYASSEQDRRNYHSNQLSLMFEFKTYWENSLLFFCGDEQKGDFVALDIHEGRVRFQYYMGGVSFGAVETDYKYNTNKWVNVVVDRVGLAALIRVNGEEKQHSAKPGNTGLDLLNSLLYFGGTPAAVGMSRFTQITKIEVTPFLGCMRNIQFGARSVRTLNLFDGFYVGMSEGCKDQGIRIIGYYGDGFTEYAAANLKEKESDFSLSFVTDENDALLMLAKDRESANYYSISIKDGQIQGKFSGSNSDPVLLTSDDSYNDGLTHNVAIVKTRRKVKMLIDDQLVAEGTLPRAASTIDVVSPDKDGLYVGGVPEGFTVGEMANSKRNFYGCISDIVLNGDLLNLNKPVQYTRADIGRCTIATNIALPPPVNRYTNGGNPTTQPSVTERPVLLKTTLKPLPTTTTTTTRATTTTEKSTTKQVLPLTDSPVLPTIPGVLTTTVPPVSCAQDGIYGYMNASAFGNSRTSFAKAEVNKQDIITSFSISFMFRTFYDAGMLFYVANKDQSDYVSAEIAGGLVVLSYQHRKDKRTLTSDNKLSDGKWHKVLIDKGRRRISLLVDQEGKKKGKIRQRLDVESPIYVGGLPDSYVLQQGLVNHSIRGCLANFSVNGDVMDITNTPLLSGINHCFSKVEPGVYFPPNSYGVVAESFTVGFHLTLSLEFRTAKPNGILLTVSDQTGQPGMTLELHEGKVKFSISNEVGRLMAVSGYDNSYRLCDQKWHKVTAQVIKNVLTVQVDDAPSSPGISDGSFRFTDTNDPLFIGGYADWAPQGATLSKEQFSGCLRNFKINSADIDWYSLKVSNEVHRISCPYN